MARETSAGPAADNRPIRTVSVTRPDRKDKAILTFPMRSGRNFDEILRLPDSLRLRRHTGPRCP
jgi:alkyl hydroperoxide reductase subunit AhpC